MVISSQMMVMKRPAPSRPSAAHLWLHIAVGLMAIAPTMSELAKERVVPRPDCLALRIDEIDIGLKQNGFVGEVAWFGFGHSSTVHEAKQTGEEPACSMSGLAQGLITASGSLPPGERHDIGGRAYGEDGIVGRPGNAVDDIARNVHAHPSLSEALMEAAHGLAGGYINI